MDLNGEIADRSKRGITQYKYRLHQLLFFRHISTSRSIRPKHSLLPQHALQPWSFKLSTSACARHFCGSITSNGGRLSNASRGISHAHGPGCSRERNSIDHGKGRHAHGPAFSRPQFLWRRLRYLQSSLCVRPHHVLRCWFLLFRLLPVDFRYVQASASCKCLTEQHVTWSSTDRHGAYSPTLFG